MKEQIWWISTAGSERIDVDKLQNSQEADRTEQGKNEQSQTTEKSLNRRTILRKRGLNCDRYRGK